MAIKIALAGNPNCGKTTLFNALTGSSQYVGNWPGVTVEKKEGKLKGYPDVIIQDLPGIYSLSPYTLEEVVSREYLVTEKPDAIIDIIDGTNIERNLYLTTQLIELGIPVIIAVNMIDLVRKNGDEIDLKRLGNELGCTVLSMSALKGEGTSELAQAAVLAAKNGRRGELPHVFTGSVEHALAHIEESIAGQVDERNLRWFAIKLFERDKKVRENLKLDPSLLEHLDLHIQDCEKELDDDAESIITNQRYAYIAGLVSHAVKKRKKKESLTTSDRIDRIVTNRILALPIFLVIMAAVYYVSVTSLGTIVTDFTNDTLFGAWIQPAVQGWLENIGCSAWLVSLIVDGIIGGLAAPIGFAPQMAILFLFLAMLEDCGYMARVAFIMDRIFRRFGLSGKSFIPLLISSGCGVPAIMATRTIEDEKDRRLTIMTTTFVPCGAKLPVIALIAGYIMGNAWWVSFLMYVMGIAAVIISSIILKKTKPFSGDPAPFVMELPAYHVPSASNVLRATWERVSAFLKKAGTILFLCVAVMWFLGSFGTIGGSGFHYLADAENAKSWLEYIGGFLAPIFAPLGFGTWQAVSSSLSGFVAKEGIVSTMAVIAGISEDAENLGTMVSTTFFAGSSLAAMSFLIFNLLDSPCLAAISTIAKEMNSQRWTWFAILYQNLFAYGVCLMVYQFGMLIQGNGFSAGSFFACLVLLAFLYLLFRRNPHERVGSQNAVSANA